MFGDILESENMFKPIMIILFVSLALGFIWLISINEHFRALLLLGAAGMIALFSIGYYVKTRSVALEEYYNNYVIALNIIVVVSAFAVYFNRSLIGTIDTILIVLIVLAALIWEFGITKYKIVPQHEKWLIVRNGKPHRLVGPGPIRYHEVFEEVRKKFYMKEIKKDVAFETLTKDNILLKVNAFVVFKLLDPLKAYKKTANYEDWMAGNVKGSIRGQFAQMTLDEILANRGGIKAKLVEDLNKDAGPNGIKIVLANASEITIPSDIKKARQDRNLGAIKRGGMQKNAELQKYIKELQADVALKVAKNRAEAEKAFIEATGLALELIRENGAKVDGELLKDILLGDKYMKAMESISKSENTKLVLQSADMKSSFMNRIQTDEEEKEG